MATPAFPSPFPGGLQNGAQTGAQTDEALEKEEPNQQNLSNARDSQEAIANDSDKRIQGETESAGGVSSSEADTTHSAPTATAKALLPSLDPSPNSSPFTDSQPHFHSSSPNALQQLCSPQSCPVYFKLSKSE